MNEIYESYYKELDPEKRLEILNSLPESENKDFLKKIHHDRYTNPQKPNQKKVDWWLWRCVCLTMLTQRGGLFKNFTKRELNDIFQELHMNDSFSQEQNDFLYHEYKNTARRYLSTCKTDGYASGFLGLKRATEDEKIYKACEDIFMMSEGIAIKGKCQEKMKLWCDAFYSELMNYDSSCRDNYEAIKRRFKR